MASSFAGRDFNASPDLVGGMGSSSGGHLVMLSAMRPHDPRYASIPLSGADEPMGERNVPLMARFGGDNVSLDAPSNQCQIAAEVELDASCHTEADRADRG